MSESNRKRLQENWQRIVDEVATAAAQAGRAREEIRIIGVSKYVDVETTKCLRDVGCADLGESRPQQLVEKAAAFTQGSVTWHMIGHLQRNKAKRVVEIADVIHSVDNLKLLESIATYAQQVGSRPHLLMEVNISGDEAKYGFTPSQLLELWPEVMQQTVVPVVGLMAMAGLKSTGEDMRREFAAVRQLRDTIRERYGAKLNALSMGMSGDFEAAIAEGATLVRIGSRLFEGL